ncbi:class V chitinase-like isoform X2 [Malania oleifera]|uniref:class V chitinase-like isoform X2 n=1 Tax=Malania oleifera TaxID=397392 RepID=UPI0025AE08DC|nr:class V chitinase-like isoform X2 [Malania oleifera]
MAFRVITLLLFFLCLELQHFQNAQAWIKSGSWYSGYGSLVSDIDSSLFTHLFCCYAYVGFNTFTRQISILSSNNNYFSTFTEVVKPKNPSITTLLSIWVGDTNSSLPFSSVTSHPSLRKAFIESSIKTARLYGFHGLDISGFAPNKASNMTNLEHFLNEWRSAVKSESANSGKSQLLLTMGVYYLPSYNSITYPVKSMQRNLDWVIVSSFHYHGPWNSFTAPPAALYDPYNYTCTDFGIKEWIRRGLSANKLVLGLAYYGYAWTPLNPEDSDISAPASGVPAITANGFVSYKEIKQFIESHKATSVYNSTYVVNYCRSGSIWIAFDGVESIKTKVLYAGEKGLLGYNAWEVSLDYNSVLSKASASEEDKDLTKKLHWLIILLPIATVTLLLSFIIWCTQMAKRSKGIKCRLEKFPSRPRINKLTCKKLDNNDSNLQAFSFVDIGTATNYFSSENKLGEGGFGPVYKGILPGGQEIAVKRLSQTSKQGLKEFENEVTLTAKLQHINLVRLLGFCSEREEKVLIYEYMPNKSLDFYIFDQDKRLLLDWKKRVHIIEGVTQGLLYLQEYSRLTILHRDLKASNILLDSEMKPKISDFGLARIFEKDESETNTNHIWICSS